MWKFKHFIH